MPPSRSRSASPGRPCGGTPRGAVAGALAGEGLLIERLGLAGTGLAAAVLNLTAWGVASRLAPQWGEGGGEPAPAAAALPPPGGPPAARARRLPGSGGDRVPGGSGPGGRLRLPRADGRRALSRVHDGGSGVPRPAARLPRVVPVGAALHRARPRAPGPPWRRDAHHGGADGREHAGRDAGLPG